jgi:hypothetical protein
MILSCVKTIDACRLPNGEVKSFFCKERTRDVSYIKLVNSFVLIHSKHQTVVVPMSNVSYFKAEDESELPGLGNHGKEGTPQKASKKAKGRHGHK